MIIPIDLGVRFGVKFDPRDREEGYDDDIRFTIYESAAGPLRMFAADETSILLTPEQAEQLALALLTAVAASRATPR